MPAGRRRRSCDGRTLAKGPLFVHEWGSAASCPEAMKALGSSKKARVLWALPTRVGQRASERIGVWTRSDMAQLQRQR